jgi:ribose transport system substrate-binding protein
MSITGLGPHGERAVPADQIAISDADAEEARRRRFSVAVVLHTTTSDWSKQELAGIVTTLGRYSAAVVDVVDCSFSWQAQVTALRRLSQESVDAVISIPIGNIAVADAHRDLAHAGIKLVLMDNAPTGMLPLSDYVSVVSADNFGLGEIGAELLAPYVPSGGTAGILGYGVDFFATHEREIAFRRWMGSHRPDIELVRARFSDVSQVKESLGSLIDAHPELSALFAVWDVPAMRAVSELRARGLTLPVTTVDLGNEAAAELAWGRLIKGIAAQKPYDQGVALGLVTILALLERPTPAWMALPGLPVTRQNVLEAYQIVWHAPAPSETVRGRMAAGLDSPR